MKFLISFIALGIAILLFSLASWALHYAFTDDWTWALVALPIYTSSIVAFLVTSAGFSSVKDY